MYTTWGLTYTTGHQNTFFTKIKKDFSPRFKRVKPENEVTFLFLKNFLEFFAVNLKKIEKHSTAKCRNLNKNLTRSRPFVKICSQNSVFSIFLPFLEDFNKIHIGDPGSKF